MPTSQAASMMRRASSSLSPCPKNAGAEPIPPKLPQPRTMRGSSRPVPPSGRRSICEIITQMAPRPIAVGPLPDRVRHRFGIFERLVYINSCSQGALSDAVRGSYERYLADWDEQGAPWEYWVERTEAARAAFAKLINAAPEEIAVTTSLSAGVAALASGIRFAGPRHKVVLSDWEFPTIGQIWHAQESRGARVVHVREEPDGTIPPRAFRRAIDDETKLVSITHVCYRNGAKLDVKPIVAIAHERGVPVLLDAYQSVGSLPIDVKALGVDFLAAGVLKYLLGSAGL